MYLNKSTGNELLKYYTHIHFWDVVLYSSIYMFCHFILKKYEQLMKSAAVVQTVNYQHKTLYQAVNQ